MFQSCEKIDTQIRRGKEYGLRVVCFTKDALNPNFCAPGQCRMSFPTSAKHTNRWVVAASWLPVLTAWELFAVELLW